MSSFSLMGHNTPPSPFWIPYWYHKPQVRLRLFCFPYAGRGASLFRNLPEQAPSEVEICPVQLPGREARFAETPFSSLSLLVAKLHDFLLPYLDIPYAFFGHSMGALISFELARALRGSGLLPAPTHLFVSGHRAPHLPEQRPPVHHLSEPQFIEALHRLQGTPEEVLNHTELMTLLLPLLRADFALCETYHYISEPPLSCPISAFGGLSDQDVSPESLAAWREHTSASFRLHFFPGGHFFLHTQHNALWTTLFRELLSDLRAC